MVTRCIAQLGSILGVEILWILDTLGRFWVGRTQNIAAGTSYGLAASHLPFFKLVRIHSSQWLKHLYTVDFRFDLTEEQFLRCSLCFKQKNEWTFMFLGSGAPVLFRILLSCVHRKFQSPVADGSTSEVQDVCCEQRVLARSLPPRSQGKIMSVWWFGTWIFWLSIYIYIFYIYIYSIYILYMYIIDYIYYIYYIF